MNRFLPGNRVTLLRSGGEYFPALVLRDRRRAARGLARDLHLRRRRCRRHRDGRAGPGRAARHPRARARGRMGREALLHRVARAPVQGGRGQAAEVPPRGEAVAFPLEPAAPPAPQALPCGRQDRLRGRHQHHRRREHAGTEAAARRLRAAHRGPAAGRDRAHDAARLGDQRARAVPAERGTPVSGAAARAAGRRADGQVRDPGQSAPSPRHRARVPRRDPHGEARDPDRQFVFLSGHPLPPRADRGGAARRDGDAAPAGARRVPAAALRDAGAVRAAPVVRHHDPGVPPGVPAREGGGDRRQLGDRRVVQHRSVQPADGARGERRRARPRFHDAAARRAPEDDRGRRAARASAALDSATADLQGTLVDRVRRRPPRNGSPGLRRQRVVSRSPPAQGRESARPRHWRAAGRIRACVTTRQRRSRPRRKSAAATGA